MAAFGNLGFSRVIRTILPGTVLAVILASYVDSIAWLARGNTPVLDALSSNPATVVGVGVLVALVAGNFSNMVVWSWLNPRLVWQPFDADDANARILTTNERLRLVLVERIERELGVKDLELADLGYLVDSFIDLDKLIHLEEDFWYHLEYQMNSLFGLMVALPIAPFLSVRASVWLGLNWLGSVAGLTFVLVAIGSASALWLRAARMNFRFYMLRRSSQVAGCLAFSVPGRSSKPDG